MIKALAVRLILTANSKGKVTDEVVKSSIVQRLVTDHSQGQRPGGALLLLFA